MNLFEAKKLLQSVGYTVQDDPAWAKFDRICEAVLARMPDRRLTINEMAKKAEGTSSLGKAVLGMINSMDSKRSNLKSGKAKTSSISDKTGVYDKYTVAWEDLKDAVESGDANEADTKVYNMFIAGKYDEALENDDITLIQTANSTHGAKGGMDFNAAVAQGDIKRAIQCLKNSRRSGGGERAIESMKSKLAQIWEMDEADQYEAELTALDAAINGLTAGSRGSRNADTYTVDANGATTSLMRALGNFGITATENEDGTVSFVATPSKAASISSLCDKRGWSITKAERERRVVSQKTTRTIVIDGSEDDFNDAMDLALANAKDITFEPGEDNTITITGTPGKIDAALANLDNMGIEYSEA